jgi:hypothetical protein
MRHAAAVKSRGLNRPVVNGGPDCPPRSLAHALASPTRFWVYSVTFGKGKRVMAQHRHHRFAVAGVSLTASLAGETCPRAADISCATRMTSGPNSCSFS